MRNGVPLSSPQSNTAMTFGWLRPAATCASERKRRKKPSSSARAGCRSLTATRRRSVMSSARKTCADAPVPIGASRRYRPPRTRPTRSAPRVVAIFLPLPLPGRGPNPALLRSVGPLPHAVRVAGTLLSPSPAGNPVRVRGCPATVTGRAPARPQPDTCLAGTTRPEETRGRRDDAGALPP